MERFMRAANTSESKNICKQFGIFNYLKIPQHSVQGLWTTQPKTFPTSFWLIFCPRSSCQAHFVECLRKTQIGFIQLGEFQLFRRAYCFSDKVHTQSGRGNRHCERCIMCFHTNAHLCIHIWLPLSSTELEQFCSWIYNPLDVWQVCSPLEAFPSSFQPWIGCHSAQLSF